MRKLFKDVPNYLYVCIISSILFFPAQSSARRTLIPTVDFFAEHQSAQKGTNIRAVYKRFLEEGDVIKISDKDPKYIGDNEKQPYPGITLVTGIDDAAKDRLVDIIMADNSDNNIVGLRSNSTISDKVDFVPNESLHMTLADLVTSKGLYCREIYDRLFVAKYGVLYTDYEKSEDEELLKEATKEAISRGVDKSDIKELLEKVIGPAFGEFLGEYTGKGIELKVSVNGIGMFPQGVLFFSVCIESNEFMELKSLRDEIQNRFEKFGKPTATLYDDYITHVTIGYLKSGLELDPAKEDDCAFFEALISIDEYLLDDPISFTIRSGVVVPFDNMDTYGNNIFSRENDPSILDEINFP